jgi:hypothetical protein
MDRYGIAPGRAFVFRLTGFRAKEKPGKPGFSGITMKAD